MSKIIKSLKKEVKNTGNKKSKPLSKLKVDFNGDIYKAIEKINKFWGSQVENSSNYSLGELKEIFNFKNIQIDIEFLPEEISKKMSYAICKTYEFSCVKLLISTIYDIENKFEVHVVLGGKAPKASRNSKYYGIHPNHRFQYYKILDFNYLLGVLTSMDTSFEYFLERKNYYSHYKNNYEFKDLIEILNLNLYSEFSMNYNLSLSEKRARINNFYKVCQMTCDATMVLAYESNRLQLMEDYNKNQESDYAKSYQTKKNIPDKIKNIMDNNEFLRDFTYVETDELTDIEKFKAIEKEYLKLRKEFNFEKLFKKKAELRFRRLGKLKALGAYYSHANCVCIDINSPRSFMHEIAHLIDYTYDEHLNLSMKDSFTEIAMRYSSEFFNSVEQLDEDDPLRSYYKRKLGYYTTPTEIFAFSFEIYLLKKEYTSSFCRNGDEVLNIKHGFPNASEELINLIMNYFNDLIKIEKINDSDIEKEYTELKKETTLFDFTNKNQKRATLQSVNTVKSKKDPTKEGIPTIAFGSQISWF